MRLYTSYWQNPRLGEVDAQIVSISRGQPRWSLPFSYRRLMELAPSKATFTLEDREAFTTSYLRQLEEIGAQVILDRLEGISSGRPVVALCWERLADPSEWCHRRMLADYIERELGIKVPELQPGMLPERSDSPEPRLF